MAKIWAGSGYLVAVSYCFVFINMIRCVYIVCVCLAICNKCINIHVAGVCFCCFVLVLFVLVKVIIFIVCVLFVFGLFVKAVYNQSCRGGSCFCCFLLV